MVCAFWAAVETWRYNMADSVEDDPLPPLEINVSFKVTKTQWFMITGECTLMKTYIYIYIPFLPVDPPESPQILYTGPLKHRQIFFNFL